jgi:hypothetical protein
MQGRLNHPLSLFMKIWARKTLSKLREWFNLGRAVDHSTERGSAGSTSTTCVCLLTLTRRYRARYCAYSARFADACDSYREVT